MALVAKALISLMALGALFLKVTPCSYPFSQHPNSNPAEDTVKKQKKTKKHTRLCMWMVYSRATTSAMAERVAFPEGFLDDILSRFVSAGDAVLQR